MPDGFSGLTSKLAQRFNVSVTVRRSEKLFEHANVDSCSHQARLTLAE